MMRQFTLVVFLAGGILIAFPFASRGQQSTAPAAAVTAKAEKEDEEEENPEVRAGAEQWLAQADNGKAPAGWKGLSSTAAVKFNATKWQEAFSAAREKLGAPHDRQFKDMRLFLQKDTGEKQDFYIVIFNSVSIETGPLRELVTMVKDADGVWRAAGYSIEPRRAGMDESD